MKLASHVLAAAITAVVLSATSGSVAAQPEFRFSDRPIEGRYIVVLNEAVARLDNEAASGKVRVNDLAQQMAREYRFDVIHSYSHALRGFAVSADDEALKHLLNDDRIAYVEEDGVVTISATQSNATWGLDRVDQRDLPLNSTYIYDTTASNVNTYIVDTGVLGSHSQFTGRMIGGYTAISDGRGTTDCNGHGTHVAGTVAGTTHGVAKGAKISPIRVLGCNGSGTNSGVIAGMDWVTANHIKPAVANMSLGGGASTATDDAVTRMHNAGVTVVVAAGNDNANACNYSPARAPVAVTVGSTANNDARSSFSNFGTCLDIFAPGTSITSAWHTSNTATNTISGTSMAAPHVAGVAALFLANNPTATPTQVTNALINNSTANKVTSAGSGSPNRLLYSIFGGSTEPPPPPPPSDNVLTKGVAVTGLAASTGNSLNYTMVVPTGASNLTFTMSGGTGDADLYVRRGSAPTTTTYDCRPYLNGNNETCTFASPQAGTYYVMVRAYSSFSGVSLIGNYTESSGGSPQTYTNGTDISIPDNNSTGVYSNISVTGRTGNGPSSTPVNVQIIHTYIGDLIVDLVSPSGTVFNLHNRSGGSTRNINQTYNVNLSGQAINGTWRLRVRDVARQDTGYIDSWSITF